MLFFMSTVGYEKIRGSYMEVIKKPFYENEKHDDYFHVTLTDEERF